MKYILSILTCLIISLASFSQNNFEAEREHKAAEKALSIGKYNEAVEHLKNMETQLGSRTLKTSDQIINILYDRINFYDVSNPDNQLVRACLDFYKDYAKKHPNEIDKAELESIQSIDERMKKVEIAKAEENKKDIRNYVAFRKKEELYKQMQEYKEAKEALNQEDYQKAMKLFKAAAAKGNPLAEMNIGLMYNLGRGVDENDREAIIWFTRAADNGNIDALSDQSFCYHYFYDEERWQETPYFNALLRGADAGSEECYFYLAGAYSIGTGTAKDDSRAVYWYKKAVAKEGCLAMESIAESYYKGGKNLNQNKEEAFRWYMKAATLETYYGKEFPGSKSAMFELYKMYYTGNGIEKNQAEGFKWLLKLSTLKAQTTDESYWIGEAYCELGNAYYTGTLVQQNYIEAFKWFTLGAETKPRYGQNKACMEKLATMYREGQGVKKDLKLAEEWYKKSRPEW